VAMPVLPLHAAAVCALSTVHAAPTAGGSYATRRVCGAAGAAGGAVEVQEAQGVRRVLDTATGSASPAQ
jgi:hypothetical protein